MLDHDCIVITSCNRMELDFEELCCFYKFPFEFGVCIDYQHVSESVAQLDGVDGFCEGFGVHGLEWLDCCESGHMTHDYHESCVTVKRGCFAGYPSVGVYCEHGRVDWERIEEFGCLS